MARHIPRERKGETMLHASEPVYAALLRYTKALSVALGLRDALTRLHSERVLGLSESIGMAYGLSEDELTILKFAAAFHDIGKIGISDQILKKPSVLDDTEWEIMKQHSAMGAEIMSATELPEAPQVRLQPGAPHVNAKRIAIRHQRCGEKL